MLEKTLIESIDNISSPLSYNNKLLQNQRGIYSKWYSDRYEIYKLCRGHLEITLNLRQEIIWNILHIECTPNPLYILNYQWNKRKRN